MGRTLDIDLTSYSLSNAHFIRDSYVSRAWPTASLSMIWHSFIYILYIEVFVRNRKVDLCISVYDYTHPYTHIYVHSRNTSVKQSSTHDKDY